MYWSRRQEMAHRVAVGGGDQLHGPRRNAVCCGGLGQQIDNRPAGMRRFLPAAQNDRVAALDANRRRVRRDVGPRFVDKEDHAQRHADFADLQPVRPHGRLDDFPDRIAQHGDFFQGRRDLLDPGRRQSQPVDRSVAQSETGRRRQISGVARQDVAAALAQQPGGQLEPFIFLSPADQSQLAGRALGRLRHIQAVRLEIRRFDRGHDVVSLHAGESERHAV